MVYRVYVEKKEGQRLEADGLFFELKNILGIKGITGVRVLNRYDVETDDKDLFINAVKTVLSEPQVDDVYYSLPALTGKLFAVEYLPGQFDQRADSAEQCIQIVSGGERPSVATAKVYAVFGDVSDKDIETIKKHVINPVEAREAGLGEKKTLKNEMKLPDSVKTLDGFTELKEDGLKQFISDYGLAMDLGDIKFCQEYFLKEKRNPTITEIRMIDTYWSDHCRHTTFLTTIDEARFADEKIQKAYDHYLSVRKELKRTKPINLMDLATIAVKYLKKEGKLDKLDESEEINACTVKIQVTVDGEKQDWLLLFKNETHNHPTEIEPFGGAATCIGGAIRDPLSGRAYVYGAMRVTGAGNPLKPVSETLAHKLPQRKLVTTAAAGYSSYGNQIGLATGQVDEIYHEGYVAKRMEIGAVIAATPANHVRRERPSEGDVVILIGGRTGRDGCGGATGSSKSHNSQSLETCAAEVQKGNAPEERKLQRLFRNKQAARMIKRCNDFGAGGVSVAIGELAEGLEINLDLVPKKYDGLDGTELAISESQERMAVVVEKHNEELFKELANSENIEATTVAKVTSDRRLKMYWKGKAIVDISRDFLDSNGAEKHTIADVAPSKEWQKTIDGSFTDLYKDLASDLNVCSKRGLSERFDSTIGAGTVVMPFGGKYQLTPSQSMVQKISLEKGDTDDISFMSWGYNPYISEKDQYDGAYLAVIESVTKLIASGAEFKDVYLTFQEYFERMKNHESWGKPLASLLGAFEAQMGLGIGAIGGKDSMSGSFEDIHVPPTLVSFAVTTGKLDEVITPEFKCDSSKVYILRPEYKDNLPTSQSLIKLYDRVHSLVKEKKIMSAYTPTYGGIAEAVLKMCMGNKVGFEYSGKDLSDLFKYNYGSVIIESNDDLDEELLGRTTKDHCISFCNESVSLDDLLNLYEDKLESVYSCNIKQQGGNIPVAEYRAGTVSKSPIKVSRPKVIIPVFPGTNCEFDSAKAFEKAGAAAEIFVIKNRTKEDIAESVSAFAKKLSDSQMMFIPGGFSGGDEPDGSGKFITAFMRNTAVADALTELLDKRKGLVAGICNGFQALVKLGLVPFGRIVETDDTCPTLTYNVIGRHQSMIVRTRVCSNKSPWLSEVDVGDIISVPVSHGEGRFYCSDELAQELIKNGQVATQYVDLSGNPTYDIAYNPNGSVFAIEGITSPDGRVFGKMGHSERTGNGLYKNVEGNYDLKMFSAAVKYFK